MKMRNRVKNVVLSVLVILGIALISFSLYGLLHDKWGPFVASMEDIMAQMTEKESETPIEPPAEPEPPSDSTKPESSSDPTEQTGVEDLTYQMGANPDIDEKLLAELKRIIPEWNVWDKQPVDGHYHMKAGDYEATFQNTTGVSFPRVKFVFSFEDEAGSSLKKVDIYDGPLEKDGSVTLPLTVDQSDAYAHGTVYWGYEL
ncbi:MAG: hypothetical protein Q3Y08_08725 [Butyricicoccus sp.]|nr:hypothetical protein [Butyricicoccus sp.]